MSDSDTGPTSLAARLRAGDQDAFEEVFRSNYARLADYARGLVGSQDAAEDVVQEVFMTLWTKRKKVNSPENVAAYLFRSVRNRGLNFLRHQRLVRDHRTRQAAEGVPHAAPADREAEGSEIAAAIGAAVGALPPRSREVFQLSRDSGLTYPEIAATLGISVKTVETLMGRALKAIRVRLAPFRA